MKTLFFLILVSFAVSARGESFIFVFLNKKTDKAELPKEELDKLMTAHLANIGRLAKEGKLIAAGSATMMYLPIPDTTAAP